MRMLEKGNMYIVAGATSGIGKAIGEIIEKDYYPIGGRNLETLADIATHANKKGFFIPGNLFEKGTSAYNFFIEEFFKYKQEGVVQLYASIDMDPIPIEEDGVIIDDYFDPRDGKKWSSEVTIEEKRNIRIMMADAQILFWKNFLESLLKRESEESLVIIYANSIISKFYENHAFRRHSEYGRLKNTITQLIEEYNERLEQKNIFIKNVLLGIIDTPMFTNRGKISAERTKRIVEVVAPNIPLAGQEIQATELLNPNDVAAFLYQIGNIYPKATPNKINLFDKKHLDIEKMMRDFIHKKNNITRLIVQNIDKKDKDVVVIDERVKRFLIQLREDSLTRYYEEHIKNTKIKEKKLRDNLIMGERIVSTLSPTLSTDVFLDTCLRLEGNYP
ncbi:hypothetical protein KKC13_00935 [bacterium]|nr:hypothetical protein [bacterium]MBU1959361.1 hypothetical protein [bacterium]